MKVLLLNDTGTVPHIGCQAVSDAHARMLGQAGHQVIDRAFLGDLRRFAGKDEGACVARVLGDDAMRGRLEACDAVVVNGEGTLHHGNGTEYFAVIDAAQRLRKATVLVNAVFEAHTGWHAALSRLDDFCVRDLHSLQYARSLGLRCRLVPDSFLGARFDAGRFIDLSGRIVITDWHPARDADVGATLRTLIDADASTFYFPMLHAVHAHLWRGAAAVWASADLIITGRHHGVYLAATARKPFVALPSNTRKVEGLIEAAGATIPVCASTSEVEAALSHAMSHPGEYERLFDWMDAQMPLTTFSALGQGADESDPERELGRLREHLATRPPGIDPAHWGLGNGPGAGLHPLG